jgi:hypothetical protein
MNTINRSELPAIGAPLASGFYAGLFNLDNQLHALIVSPKEQGQTKGVKWGEYGTAIDARSCNDGLANTAAMAKVGNETAAKILQMEIDGSAGWYIPSRDELEICYRNLKPTTDDNYCTYRDGDNASSVPVGYPYTAETPAQTTAEAFQKDAPEAFDAAWHWSSTQYSAYFAYIQFFGDGYQVSHLKDVEYHVRAVRRLLVIE